MKNRVEVLCHSSIKIVGSKTIYIDPLKIDKSYHDADYVFCTHSHYDHFSKQDIEKVINKNTTIITVESSKEEALDIIENQDKVITVLPGNHYKIEKIEFETTYAYNINKEFHIKENNWVGFIIELDGERYFIAGDTDNIKEIQNIKCDIAFLPIGGTYTMNYEEAAELANTIDAKIIIPTHYGSIVGEKIYGEKFAKLIKKKKVEVFIK